MSQSQELTDFYREYLTWLKCGAPIPERDGDFHREMGLCSNLGKFCYRKKISFVREVALDRELLKQFEDAGLKTGYPFGYYQYIEAYGRAEQHLDPKRIQWVKDHVNG